MKPNQTKQEQNKTKNNIKNHQKSTPLKQKQSKTTKYYSILTFSFIVHFVIVFIYSCYSCLVWFGFIFFMFLFLFSFLFLICLCFFVFLFLFVVFGIDCFRLLFFFFFQFYFHLTLFFLYRMGIASAVSWSISPRKIDRKVIMSRLANRRF